MKVNYTAVMQRHPLPPLMACKPLDPHIQLKRVLSLASLVYTLQSLETYSLLVVPALPLPGGAWRTSDVFGEDDVRIRNEKVDTILLQFIHINIFEHYEDQQKKKTQGNMIVRVSVSSQ